MTHLRILFSPRQVHKYDGRLGNILRHRYENMLVLLK